MAVIAHVDRAFSFGFEDVMGTPQAQLLRTPLELLMKGKRVGMATDPLSLQWSTLAALLGQAQGGNLPGMPQPRTPVIGGVVPVEQGNGTSSTGGYTPRTPPVARKWYKSSTIFGLPKEHLQCGAPRREAVSARVRAAASIRMLPESGNSSFR